MTWGRTVGRTVRKQAGGRSTYRTETILAISVAMLWVNIPVQAQQTGDGLKQVMGEQRFRAAGLHKLTQPELLQLMGFIAEVSAANPPNAATALKRAEPPKNAPAIAALEGGSIVAEDGTYLGRIDKDKFESKSLSNKFGDYGNKFSSTSILNKFGEYGSKFSSTSAFNRLASDPPRVLDRTGMFVGYLTVNPNKRPQIDPVALIGWLGLE